MRNVPASGVILDLGSGGNPLPQATILTERHIEDTRHRAGRFQRDARPVVVLDVHHLPFADKSIDYLYCSHVLEHVEDPKGACAEIMRVAKAGYIETPTRMKDLLFSWAEFIQHKWHVVCAGNRLVFFEYDPELKAGLRTDSWTRTILGDWYHPNQDLYYPNQHLFNTWLEWGERFDVTVFRQGE